MTLHLSVSQCPRCHGDHASVRFEPLSRPGGQVAHRGVCPKTGQAFVMESDPEKYRRLLAAAGVK